MKKLFIFIFSAVLLFSYDLKIDKNGIKVYTYKIKNSKYDAFKAQMTLKQPFTKIKNALLDFKSYPKWQKKISKIEVKGSYMLKVLDFPFPFSDRFSFYKIEKKENKNSIVIILKSIPYSKLPQNIKKEFNKPSCVEMKDDVVMKAVKKPEGVYVVYSAKVDPNGAPAFIFNAKIPDAGYETLNNLRKILK